MAVGLVFVALTAGLSDISWALINPTQTVNAPYLFGVMWMPGVASWGLIALCTTPSPRSSSGTPTFRRGSGWTPS
jgi:hypothetical protein